MADFKMTKEQKKLFDELTRLQQEIAVNSISGMSDIDSYRASSGKSKKESTMRASVCEILANPNVAAFVDSMKAAAVSSAVMSREEMLERLSMLSRVGINDLIEWTEFEAKNADGDIIKQSTWSVKDSAIQDPVKMSAIAELAATREGIKIKTHSQLAAMNQLATLAGYNAASKHEHTNPDGSLSMPSTIQLVAPKE